MLIPGRGEENQFLGGGWVWELQFVGDTMLLDFLSGDAGAGNWDLASVLAVWIVLAVRAHTELNEGRF